MRSTAGIWLKISVACQRGCYIFCDKPPKLPAISLRRIRSSVFVRIVAASGSLPQQNFDFGRRSHTPTFAQNDIQSARFLVGEAFRLPKTNGFPCASFQPVGEGRFCEANLPRSEAEFACILPKRTHIAHKGGRTQFAPTINFIVSRRGELCSPVFINGKRSFSGDRRSPLLITKNTPWRKCTTGCFGFL